MTTYFPFTPSTVSAPIFSPTLDGDLYTISVTSSLYGQRYYLNCYDLSGNRVFTKAVIETATGLDIESLSWDILSNFVTVTTVLPHGYQTGNTLNLTIEGCTPDTYNGLWSMLVTGPDTLVYLFNVDPGEAMVLGQLSYIVSIAAGYFDSTLIFRANQFEVSP